MRQKPRPEGCECPWHAYTVGDGCPACNPEFWKRLIEEIESWPDVEESDVEPPEPMF